MNINIEINLLKERLAELERKVDELSFAGFAPAAAVDVPDTSAPLDETAGA